MNLPPLCLLPQARGKDTMLMGPLPTLAGSTTKSGAVFRIWQADISTVDYWNGCKRILSLVIMQ